MGVLSDLIGGLDVALTAVNIWYCFVGVLLGTLIGVLPGVGPVPTIAMLLPITFGLPPTASLIMLAGVYYGAQYGGSTSAILMNMPGESSSVVTCLDGYQMARKGRAGAALGIAAIGSFIAGTIATLVIAVSAPSLSSLALRFGPPDYFALMVLGLVAAVALASGSVLKAYAMILLGLLLGLVGTDVNSGMQRMTFNVRQLGDGIDFVIIAIGLFGVTEIIANLSNPEGRGVVSGAIGSVLPSRSELRQSTGPIARGTIIGSLLGVLPGGGALLAAFVSYTVEKRLAKEPSRFGNGAIEGVAAAESANNAGAQTSFIPLLTLGIPSNAVMALMMGAMTIQGIIPGPQVISSSPDLFWGLIASMWIGNLMLLFLNLPLVGVWVKLLQIPYRWLAPSIVIFCCFGVISTNNDPFSVVLMTGFGLLGYAFLRLGCEPAPLLLGFILGPLMEEHLRRALLLSGGDPSTFVTESISCTLLVAAVILFIVTTAPVIRRKREAVFVEN
jgi:putative tricarboxylic transport membrane protein